MKDESNIRLNKVLRKLNMSTVQAIKILENHGYKVNLNPKSKITIEQQKTLMNNPKDFLSKRTISDLPEISISKPKLKVLPKVKKAKAPKRRIKRQNAKRDYHFLKRKPEKSDLMSKIKRICLGKPLEKVAILLDIPNSVILEIAKSIIPNCGIQHRISDDDFEMLEPKLEILVQEFIDDLPNKKIGEIKGKKYKPSTYTKTSKYYDFVRIIYTNM